MAQQHQQPEKPWLPNFLAQVALSTGVGYVAAAYTVSRWLTRPSAGRPQETPDRLGLPWDRLECRTGDGLRLRGWVVQPPRPRATVAIFHGIRRNRASVLGRMAVLAAEGYRCVAFDHRRRVTGPVEPSRSASRNWSTARAGWVISTRRPIAAWCSMVSAW